MSQILSGSSQCNQRMAFQNIELLKKETLGTGSYGAVFKAKCDQLICAAKLLYPVLFNIKSGSNKDHKLPFQRFESECCFLSQVQHPHIVQYLGTYRDPETNAPVLLMELMDESLTHFLESSPGDLPYHTQVNLSYDIAQALAFLHTNDIVHRDLSSNNVLLLAGRAKIADFGMSKFDTDLATMTMCPGTAVYMSPEALDSPPVYTEKLDVFSLGVLMIQILTRLFPHPTSRLTSKEVIDPTHRGKKIQALVIVPEGQRRYLQISQIDLTHPLLPLAQQCIRDIDTTRPSSAELCGILTCVKESKRYKTSQEHMVEGSTHSLSKKDAEQRQANMELQEMKEKLDNALKEIRKLKENSDKNSFWRKRKGDDYMVHSLLRVNDTLERPTRHDSKGNIKSAVSLQNLGPTSPCISRPTSPCISRPSPLPSPQHSTGDWKPLPDCPINVRAGSSTVVGNKAYFQNKDSGAIVEYDSTSRQWRLTPFHTLKQCGLACFEETLTTVGGYDIQSKISNKLYSFVENKWKEMLPPMTTQRDSPAVLSTNTSLIVAGGRNKFQSPLRTVEIFGACSRQWTSAKALPFPTYQASTVAHAGCMYMTAGEGAPNQHSVVRISIDALNIQENIYINASSSLSRKAQETWKHICDLPVQNSRLAEVNGHLLALGGSNPPKKNSSSYTTNGTQTVYKYNVLQNTWSAVSHMTLSRHHCLAAVLPGNNIIVVGGVNSSHERAKCTEYMTMNK